LSFFGPAETPGLSSRIPPSVKDVGERAAASPGSRAGSRAAPAWQAFPFAVFAVLYAVSFKRWLIPFQDSGREMHVPARLAAGEALYRDVGYFFGPLPAYLDALLLRVFGRDLDVLVAWRTLLALLAVEALRRLALRLAPDARVGACAAAFAVAACAFGLGGAWPFPYSVAALEGTAALWWALEISLSAGSPSRVAAAALVGGLAAGTKVEFLPAAVAVLGFSFFARRPKAEAAAATLAVAVVGSVPFAASALLWGRSVLESHGFLVALHTPPAWKSLYTRMVLFGGNTPEGMLAGAWCDAVFPSVPLLVAALGLSQLAPSRWPRALPGVLGAAVGAASALVPGNEELHVLLPVGILVAALECVLWLVSGPAARADRTWTARVAIGVLALAAAVRMPLFLRNPIYGAFAAPLALVVAVGWMGRIAKSRTFVAGLAAGLTLAQGYDRWAEYRDRPWEWVSLPGARLYLPPEEARLIRDADALVREKVAPGGYVAVLPEPGLVLFTTGRRSPFVDEQFHPQHQDARGEDEMIEALRTRAPEVFLVTNRPFGEFGPFAYGHGVLDRFSRAVLDRYTRAGRLGAPPREAFRERRATEATVWVPSERPIPPAR
jgi:hypothetical protein